MKRQRSLKWQLINGNTLIFTLLLALFGAAIYLAIQRSIILDIEVHNHNLVRVTNDRVNQFIETPVEMIKQMSEHIKFEDMDNNKSVINTYLNTIVNVYPFIQELKVVDPKGNVVDVAPYDKEISESSVIYEAFFINKPQGEQINWSNVYLSNKTHSPTITITANANNYLMVGDLNLYLLGNMIRNEKFKSLISISILDQYGNYLIDNDLNKVEQRLRHPDFDLIKEAVYNKKNLFPSKNDPNILLTGAAVGEKNQWYLVIAEDKKEIYSSLTKLRDAMVGAFIIIVLSSIFFLYLNLKKAIQDLERLTNNTLLISEGPYDFIVKPNQFSEFQKLSDHFKKMAKNIEIRESEIQHLNVNLEAIVEDRTLQLVNTNNALEEVNAQLEEEISDRQRVEEEIVLINRSLEQRVIERTLELEQSNSYLEETNAQLEEEIEEHRRTVQLLEEKEVALEKAIRIAEDANLSKSQFLANMSHEIRTPMNGIMGMIDVMVMTNLSKVQQGYLKTIRSSSNILLTILNDILDYSKMEAGKVKIKNEPFILEETIQDIHNLFLASTKHKGINFEVSLPQNLPKYLVGDEKRLRQVLSNLVGNALKFTTEGFIRLSLEILEKDEQRTKIRFTVKDTGVGIAETDQAQLFTRFTQFSHHDGKKTTGTGLGLAISKMLVELMGGQIGVKSQMYKGSEFYVEAYFDQAEYHINEQKHQEVGKSAQTLNSLKGLEVLVVEDDSTSLYMMKEMLSMLKATVATAVDGLGAIKAVERKTFDLILMDVNMPVMNGLVASGKIREMGILNRMFQAIPIIAMTAYAMPSDREKCLDAGMTNYLSKPIELNSLIEVINLYWSEVSLNEGQKEIAVNLAPHNTTYSIDSSIDTDEQTLVQNVTKFMNASGFDLETSHLILRTYVNQSAELLKSLEQHFADNNIDDVGTLVHKLKGSSGNVRADAIMELARKAECEINAGQIEEARLLISLISEKILVYEKYLQANKED